MTCVYACKTVSWFLGSSAKYKIEPFISGLYICVSAQIALKQTFLQPKTLLSDRSEPRIAPQCQCPKLRLHRGRSDSGGGRSEELVGNGGGDQGRCEAAMGVPLPRRVVV
jgi:hypothetical protein